MHYTMDQDKGTPSNGTDKKTLADALYFTIKTGNDMGGIKEPVTLINIIHNSKNQRVQTSQPTTDTVMTHKQFQFTKRAKSLQIFCEKNGMEV